MPLTIEILEKPVIGKATLKLKGEFDFHSNHEFRKICDKILGKEGTKMIEVELSGLTEVDSSALGLLLLILQDKAARRNQSIVVKGANNKIQEILKTGDLTIS